MTTTKTEDKRNKQCEWCKNDFYDKTRPNNAVVCSRKCRDERRKENQRKQYREENPYKPNQREEFYYDHHEYSFWLHKDDGQDVSNAQAWKYAVPYATDRVENIIAARQLDEYNGGRKRRQGAGDNYDGDKDDAPGVTVRFAEHNHKNAGEVVVKKMESGQIDKYLTDKYGSKR